MGATTQPSPGRPLLLVDVDGVISLWDWPPDTRPEGTWALIDGIAHFLSHEAAHQVRALCTSFEAVWCTGWEEKANEYLPRALGLGPFPHLTFGPGVHKAPSHSHWKLAAIDDWAGPDRALAWVDDGFTAESDAWAAARPGPTHLERTHPSTGLTAEGAERLAAWAAKLGSGA